MEVTAKTHYLRLAPRKVRLVANIIKGLSIREAALQLRFLPKRASRPVEKLLHSAIANAKHNFNLDEKNLRVKTVLVDGGPVLKRFRARAFGRAAPIRKRTSHLTLILDELIPTKVSRGKVKKAARLEVRRLTELDEVPGASMEADKDELTDRRTEERKSRKTSKPGFVKRIFNRKAV